LLGLDRFTCCDRVRVALFDGLLPLAAAAVTELEKKVDQTEKDIEALRKLIDSKSND
jgi:hypothetical protein